VEQVITMAWRAQQDVWREYARAIEKRKALDASQVA